MFVYSLNHHLPMEYQTWIKFCFQDVNDDPILKNISLPFFVSLVGSGFPRTPACPCYTYPVASRTLAEIKSLFFLQSACWFRVKRTACKDPPKLLPWRNTTTTNHSGMEKNNSEKGKASCKKYFYHIKMICIIRVLKY